VCVWVCFTYQAAEKIVVVGTIHSDSLHLSTPKVHTVQTSRPLSLFHKQPECGPMPNVMAALQSIDGALCSTLQSLADAHY